MIPREPRWSPTWYALLISGGYLTIGGAWILISDVLAQSVADTGTQLTTIQSGKGIAFVAVTGVLLAGLVYVTSRRQFGQSRFMHEALNTLEDSFYVVNTDGEVVWFNQSARETVGYDREELDEIHVSELFVEEHRNQVLTSLRTVLEDGTDDVEADVLTKSGERVPHELRGGTLTDPSGEPIGVVGIARDISDRRDQKQQLRVLDQFLRHNIRTDLNVIRGNTDLYAEETEGSTELLSVVDERCDHLLSQIEKHRKIVRVFTDPPQMVELDISAVVSKVVEERRRSFPAATIEVDVPDGVETVTSTALRLALGELLDNAIEHNDTEHPHVEVRVRPSDETVTIEISDDGPGLPDIERELLLNEVEIDQLHHGRGLGLWLVYWVVTRADGEFDVGEGQNGTTIRIHLPR